MTTTSPESIFVSPTTSAPLRIFLHKSVSSSSHLLSQLVLDHGGAIARHAARAEVILVSTAQLDAQKTKWMLHSQDVKHVKDKVWLRKCINTGRCDLYALDIVQNQATGPVRRIRTPFTASDDTNLAFFLSRMNPVLEDGGRLGNRSYNILMDMAEEDPQTYGWANRHTAHSWRERYKNQRHAYFDDEIKRLVEGAAREGRNNDIRVPRSRKTQRPRKHRSTNVRFSSPTIDAVDEGENVEEDDDFEQDLPAPTSPPPSSSSSLRKRRHNTPSSARYSPDSIQLREEEEESSSEEEDELDDDLQRATSRSSSSQRQQSQAIDDYNAFDLNEEEEVLQVVQLLTPRHPSPLRTQPSTSRRQASLPHLDLRNIARKEETGGEFTLSPIDISSEEEQAQQQVLIVEPPYSRPVPSSQPPELSIPSSQPSSSSRSPTPHHSPTSTRKVSPHHIVVTHQKRSRNDVATPSPAASTSKRMKVDAQSDEEDADEKDADERIDNDESADDDNAADENNDDSDVNEDDEDNDSGKEGSIVFSHDGSLFSGSDDNDGDIASLPPVPPSTHRSRPDISNKNARPSKTARYPSPEMPPTKQLKQVGKSLSSPAGSLFSGSESDSHSFRRPPPSKRKIISRMAPKRHRSSSGPPPPPRREESLSHDGSLFSDSNSDVSLSAS